ncbi:MAG: DNA repair protein RecO [Candidatus Pelagibacter sp.]|jgi:DNA repair protein RecO (recombination protein O)|tara:strand:+ start:768 stop:1448 length:681 start_codon:yes stop_codon:yes gene_type:complete
MIWDDKGYLLSKNKYSENSIISEVFTKDHGKVSGIIFGGTSKKIKNYLQIGNKIHVNFNSKNDNKLGYFKVEIQQALSPLYFDNQKKLSCITSAMNLIKILTAENQKNINIYELIKDFYLLLDKDNWIKRYIFWELELFRVLGYDLELKNLVDKEVVGDKLQYISKSNTNKKIIPNFLIEKNEEPVDLTNLKKGLSLIGDYLEKTILRPNNLSQPISRLNFINSLK